MIASALVGLALCAALVLTLRMRTAGDDAPPILAFVLLAAALGRAVEVSSRPSVIHATPARGYLDVVWEVLVSMVFGVALYVMLQAQVLQGSLFPAFSATDWPYGDMLSFMNEVKPVTNADAAKAVFWSFIAGFSAKFAPSLLHRASNDGEADGSASG